jgi:putative ABC transport system permease protein
MNKVPLTWRMLTHKKGRLLLAVLGIAFAVLLMFMQLGFLTGLLDNQSLFIRSLDADVVLFSPTRFNLHADEEFPRIRVAQARDVPGVASAAAIRLDSAFWRAPTDPAQHVVRVVGVDPADPALRLPGLKDSLHELHRSDTILFDRRSRAFFGLPPVGSEVEINGVAVRVGGYVDLGADFRNDATVLTSLEGYARLFPHQPAGAASLGLVRIAPGERIEDVVARLRARLPRDVEVATKAEYEQMERSFWSTMSPTGYIFTLGLAVGFVIGVMICYQVLYNEISDHLPQFATLKAIGFTNGYLVGVVLKESILLALFGLAPALLASQLFYASMIRVSGLYMELTPARVLVVSILTILMCASSGLLSISRVLQADPAEVFG